MVNMSVEIPPSSEYPGGVDLLFGYGSVHFRKNSIALGVWRAEHAQWRRGDELVGLLKSTAAMLRSAHDRAFEQHGDSPP